MRKLLAFVLCLGALPAAAANVRLGLGADLWGADGYYREHYYQDGTEVVTSATVAVALPLNHRVEVGLRAGLSVVMKPFVVGVPLDAFLRFTPTRKLYLEGLAGPWFFLADDPLRAHVAFGFGYQGEAVHFGLELAYLDPAPMLGLRLGIPL